jgi:hypothetical protein
MDFQTYRDIMSSSDLYFEVVTSSLPFHLIGIEGALDCEEALIDADKAKEFFTESLSKSLYLSTCVSLNDCVDMSNNGALVLDCTWNKINMNESLYYEVSLMFVYDVEHELSVGLTLMDGKLFSIYPLSHYSATLSDVEYTPIAFFDIPNEAYNFLNNNRFNTFDQQRELMERKVNSFFPHFSSYYKNPRPLMSIKTKQRSNLIDSRSTYMNKNNASFYSVHAGKIDTIFDIEHQVLGLL